MFYSNVGRLIFTYENKKHPQVHADNGIGMHGSYAPYGSKEH